MSQYRTLNHLARGEAGTVRSITADPTLHRRLLEMGLTRGTVCTVLRRAPLGDPLTVQVRGYQLSLRAEQAKLIEVGRPGDPS
jgi:ferrous iron transport protein A